MKELFGLLLKLLLTILCIPVGVIFGLFLGLIYFPVELAETIIDPSHEVEL